MVEFNERNEIIAEEFHRAIIVGVQGSEDISNSMEELNGLAEADGVIVAGEMIQNRARVDSTFYVGKGKVAEILEFCSANECDMVIFNDELSGAQIRNLENETDLIIIDRTTLILDIFANRAMSKEGKLQVEFAQLQYRLPRLRGMGKSLSRTGGGIGTRGPGEMKLETDRRHIQTRMDEIRKEIEEIKGSRGTQRSKREKSEIPLIALVGYTNAGKSALMNRFLTISNKEEKQVYEEDMLFATLDTATRKIKLDSSQEFVVIDTVGFVSKLPHALIKAFKSTLEEVLSADLILLVIDANFMHYPFQIDVTKGVLKELGVKNKDIVLVYNKGDLLEDKSVPISDEHESVLISAKTGYNFEKLTEIIIRKLFSNRRIVEMIIPFDKGQIVSYLCEKYEILNLEYIPEGTKIKAELSESDLSRYEDYLIKEN
jgi:GTP-binding protein HflX